MNKKQLIVAWIMGIIICLAFITTPKKYIVHLQGMIVEFDTPKPASYSVVKWEQPIIISVVTLIIGCLLMYTLRKPVNFNKQKIIKVAVWIGMGIGMVYLLFIIGTLVFEQPFRKTKIQQYKVTDQTTETGEDFWSKEVLGVEKRTTEE